MKRKAKSVWNVRKRPLKEQSVKKPKRVSANRYSSVLELQEEQEEREITEVSKAHTKLLDWDCFPFSIGVLALSLSVDDNVESLSARLQSLCANRTLCRICASEVKQDFLICSSCCDIYHHYCASHMNMDANSVTSCRNLFERSKWLCPYCQSLFQFCFEPVSEAVEESCSSPTATSSESCRADLVNGCKSGLQNSHCGNSCNDPFESPSSETYSETSYCVICANHVVKEFASLYCSTCNGYVHETCDNLPSNFLELSTVGDFYSYVCPLCRDKKALNPRLGTLKFSHLMEKRKLHSLQVFDENRKIGIAYRNSNCPFFTYVVGARISVRLQKSVISKILHLENSTADELSCQRLPPVVERRLRVLKHIEHLKQLISSDTETKVESSSSSAEEKQDGCNITNLPSFTEIPSVVVQGIFKKGQVNGVHNGTRNGFRPIPLSCMKDSRVCAFCKSDQTSLGRLLPIFHYNNCEKVRWVHSQCALFAAETFEDDTGNIHCVTRALSRGQRSRCSFCKELGATVGCCMSRCQRNYHLSCACRTSGTFLEEKKFYCFKHAKKLEASRKAKKSCTSCIEEDPQRCLFIRHEKPSDRLFLTLNPQFACLRMGSFMLIFPGYFSAEYAAYLHDEDTLSPLGYTSCRYFWSVDHPERMELYIFHVSMNDNNEAPIFKIYSTDPDSSQATWPLEGSTPDDVWKELLSRNPTIQTGLDGKKAFGLSIPAVRFILEQLTGVDECRNYKPRYVELKPKQKDLESACKDRPVSCARIEPYRGFRSKTKLEADVKSIITENEGYLTNKNVSNDIRTSDQQVQNYSTSYRKMRRRWRQRCQVKQSGIQGLGLYASENIPEEELVIEYAGELIRPVIADIREKIYEKHKIGCYMFRLNDEFIVDATMKGNYARFINHSCEPNCRSKIITVDGDKQVIGIFTKRSIFAGEELTYDYQFDEFGETIPCNCGAPNCRGKMN
ncbi:hypothetical protein GAYE_SCF15G3538 [Galdieria yellowstonensis]|uniref:Histone-lysine N-methyltransferase n=1 Tax=Galdieria yellowstonensis TaxID=3028027 RepID=A0AAV9IE79_9RHOD|nr:hypothetical protein GAYE_SCF15G3538 [Galdieria yellowstonensis]